MRGSLVLSAIGHTALLGWVLFTIQTQSPPRAPQLEPPMDFTLITPGEMTKLTQGLRTAKQLDAQPKEAPKSEPAKKEADKPKPVATAPPPPEPPPPPKEEPKSDTKSDPIAEKLASATPPPPPQPAPPPVPSAEEQKKLDDLLKAQEDARRLEQEKKEQEAKRIEEQKKREEAKKKKDEERKKQAELKKKREEERKRKEAELKKKQDDEFKKISALLNKIPDKGAPTSAEPLEPSKKRGPVAGAPEGRDKQLTASELAILAQIIKSCVQSKWTVMGGGEGAQSALVKIRLRFNPDGRLAAAPTVMNPQNTPVFLAVSDSALRAVQACEPFPLPADKYDVWKDIVLNFDPRDMF